MTTRRCMLCGNTDEAYLTHSYLAIQAQPAHNPDPDGLAGYDPLEDIPEVRLNACLLCIAGLQLGYTVIETLAENPAGDDVWESARDFMYDIRSW